jgi:hypothetical protein
MNAETFAINLAKELHKRNNPSFIGIQVGVVSKPLPDIEIKLGEAIVLDKTMLIFDENLLRHKRTFNMTTSYTDPKVVGSLQLTSEESPTQPIVKLTLETKEDGTSTAEIEFMEQLKPGREVILMPAQDQQLFYVLGMAERVK